MHDAFGGELRVGDFVVASEMHDYEDCRLVFFRLLERGDLDLPGVARFSADAVYFDDSDNARTLTAKARHVHSFFAQSTCVISFSALPPAVVSKFNELDNAK